MNSKNRALSCPTIRLGRIEAMGKDLEDTEEKLRAPDAPDDLRRSVLTSDPAMGVLRHADAGYPEAIAAAEEGGLRIPTAAEGASSRPVPGDA